jgi:hypothetical protein
LTAAELWRAVDRLLAREPSPGDLAAHGIEELAARRLRERGLPVAPELAEAERLAALAELTAPVLLRRVRAAATGTLMLLKGPEAAARYPAPGLRGFRDLDLLVPDAARVQRELLAAGFVEVGAPELYEDIHHLRPLALPGLPLAIEIHDRPKWVERLEPPPASALLELAVPCSLGVDGVSALPPAPHALVLAVHGWAHEPLRRARDLLDVALTAATADAAELDALARAWGLRRLWRSTETACAALSEGGALRGPARLWASSLTRARERTVLETHLRRCLAGFSYLPPGAALAELGRALVDEVRPRDEPWRAKVVRSARAFRDAGRRRSEHDAAVGIRS